MVIFHQLNLRNTSPLSCCLFQGHARHASNYSLNQLHPEVVLSFACTRCWAPSSARIFPWREVNTKRFMPSSTWVPSEKRVLLQAKYRELKAPGKTCTKQQSFLFNTFIRGLYATPKQRSSFRNHVTSNKKRLQERDALLEHMNPSPTKCQCQSFCSS